MNSLYSIMAIAAILSLSFCKDDKDDPEPNPMPMEEDPAGITYSQQDKSEFPDTFTLTEEDSNNNMVEYTIVLNTQPTANVEIEITLPSDAPSNLSIASGSQNESGAGSSITLTYTTDNWNNSQTVTLTLTDDTMSSSINGSLTHIVTSGDPNYNNKDTLNRTITLKLRDTEAGVLYQKDNASLPETIELTEGTDSEYRYMIVLAKQPTHDVTININLNNSPDNLRLNEGGTPVTFTSIIFTNSSGGVNGWDIPQTINLTFTDNDIFSGPVMPTLTHSTSSTDNEYMGIPNKNLMISLIDDENPTPCDQSGAVDENDFDPEIDGEDYGMGTEDNPYIICNADQLQFIGIGDIDTPASELLGETVFYELGKDIDASSITAEYTCPADPTGTCTGFQPIGTNANRFKGTLDGKGFTISDLMVNINVTGSSYAGLFGFTSGANIRNIGLLNVDIFSSATDTSFAGGLVGNNNRSSITNSYFTGNISSAASRTSSHAGGLVGNNDRSSITNSYSTGNVSSFATISRSNAGGLVGNNSRSSITNSYSTGNVSSFTASAPFSGGLVASNLSNSSITNSYSTGNVSSSTLSTSSTPRAGGLVGQNLNNNSITNSYYDLNTSTLSKNGMVVSDTDVDFNSGILTCIGGLLTSEFMAPTEPFTPPTTEPCEDDPTTPDTTEPLKPFFNWYTPFDIDNADMDNNLMTGIDQSSVRYDINDDGSVADTEPFIWNFGTDQEYPFIASIPGTVDEQAVRMASGFLRFSNTTIGELSEDDFVFFYDIDDPAMDITTSGQNVQGTTAGNYVIEDAVDASGVALATPPTVTNAGVINGVNSLAANSEFYLKVTFTRGASPNTASFTRRYRFKK